MSITPALPDVTEEAQEAQPAQGELTPEGRTALEDLVKGVLKEEKSSRISEVRKAWQQRNFSNGHQYLWWDDKTHCYMQPEASGQEQPRFTDVYNIYTPHKRSLSSILSQNPPGINFTADDLLRSVDLTAADDAERMRHRVDRLVNMKDRQSEVSSDFCTDGRTMTRTWIDKESKLRVGVYGVLETKVPIFAKKMEKWGYAVISEEEDIYELKDEFEDFADDIEGESDNGESAYERYARLGILANKRGAVGQADALKNLATRHTAWIRPARYRKAPEAIRTELKTLYPNGVRVTVISGKAVECVPETIEQALNAEWPSPGKGSSRPSLLHDLVPIQQAFNDYMNMLREHIDFSIPATWVTDTVDSEALTEQRSAPGVIHQISVPNGASITDLVMQEQVAQLPPELVANLDRLITLAEMTTGDYAALQGAGDPHSETYAGQKLLSDSAKGQLSLAWGSMQWIFAGTYELAVIEAAKLAQDKGSIAVQGGSGQEQFNPSSILDGTWGCYPNKDSAFPETEADQRASFQSVMTQLGSAGPDGLKIVMHPANLKLAKKYSGLADLYIAQADARDKQLEEIEQMLREPPIPDQTQIPQWQQAVQQAIATGQPPPSMPLTSSVPIGKRDYNEFELEFGVEWLSSRACRDEIKKGNQQGVDNVSLHLDLHEAAIAKNAPPPQFEPPKISLTGAITDANAISQLLAKDGISVTPQEIEGSNILEEQNKAADTSHKAAQAQHQSVLAAKEAVTPIQKPMTPEQQLEAKKTNAKEK